MGYLTSQPPEFVIRCTCGYNGLCTWQDHGYGAYEYGSDSGTHVQWVPVCPACEEEAPE